MYKRHWIAAFLSILSVSGLFLLTIPQGASGASNQQQEVTLEGTASETPVEEIPSETPTEGADAEIPTMTSTPMQLIVEALTGNLRSAPGLDADIIGVVRQNTRLTVMGVVEYGDEIWYLVQLGGNEQAWVSEVVVDVVGDLELVPTIDLTDFFNYTETPTWTPGGPTATASSTRRPRPTRTPTLAPLPTDDPPTNAPDTGGENPQPTQPPPHPTNSPAPTDVPTTDVPPTMTDVPPPPTDVPPPPPTDVPPPTNLPPPPTTDPGN